MIKDDLRGVPSIAKHSTSIEMPLSFVLHAPSENNPNGFKISIYQESLTESFKVSDIAFSVWYPDGRGCIAISQSFRWFRDAGLLPKIDELCQQMYEAWKKGQDEESQT